MVNSLSVSLKRGDQAHKRENYKRICSCTTHHNISLQLYSIDVREVYKNEGRRNRRYFESQENSLSPKHSSFSKIPRYLLIKRRSGSQDYENQCQDWSMEMGSIIKGKNIPFVPLILGRSEIIELFLSSHRIPNLVSLTKAHISTSQNFKLGFE
jgi:hypothetical protein